LAEIERDHGQHMGEESSRELPNSVQNQLNNAVASVWSAITPDPM
jgi:hypothetical protein